MNILVIGSGGVGTAFARIAQRRDFFDRIILGDVDVGRATALRRLARRAGPLRRRPRRRDRLGLARRADPSASRRRRAERGRPALRPPRLRRLPRAPARPTSTWPARCPSRIPSGRTRSAASSSPTGSSSATRSGARPGCSRSSAWASSRASRTSPPATPPTTCSRSSTRSPCATAPTSSSRATSSRPTFSIWTTIEECLNPALVWEKERGWFTTEPLSDPEMFEFPEGIGAMECVNVEHEEVALIPRVIDCRRVTFKYGLERRVRRRAQVAARARARLEGEDPRRRRRGRPAGRRRRVPARSGRRSASG